MPALSDVRTSLNRSSLRSAMALPPRVRRALAGRPVVIDGQELASDVQLMLRLSRVAREPSPVRGPVEADRATMLRATLSTQGDHPIGSVRSLRAAGLPARLYTPTAPAPALLVFFHGGGFFGGDLDSHDGACRVLAERGGVRVLSVEYRLAPEHRFPAAHDDAWAAYRWAVEHLDATALAVGGDSAGGNLSAHVAIEAARAGVRCDLQLLVYPVTQTARTTPSRRLFADGFYLSAEFIRVATERYGGQGDPRMEVLDAELPEGLAPALVYTAGFDPLRDEGEEYAARLPVATLHRFPSLIHGFLNVDGPGTSCPAAIARVAADLRAALSG